jgi:gliding motility-associated-like protein
MFYNDSSCVLGDVIINDQPNQNYVLNDSICNGETVPIGIANEAGHTYTWINNTTNLSSTSLATVNANPPLTTTYTLVDNSDSVCYDTITVNLHVDAMPTADFSYSYEVACNTIHLTVLDSSTNFTGGFWQLDSVQYPINNHSYNIPVENVNHQLYLEVSNNGCTDSMSVFFNTSLWAPIINLVMPNVFTPNGDATNDAYCPIGSNGSYCYKITIYNRWGTKVWESTNDGPCWNGLDYSTQQPASEGVYYYILDFDGKMEKGFLQLFK